MDSDTIIGIDLGTTNSEVAIIRDGRPAVLEEDDTGGQQFAAREQKGTRGRKGGKQRGRGPSRKKRLDRKAPFSSLACAGFLRSHFHAFWVGPPVPWPTAVTFS